MAIAISNAGRPAPAPDDCDRAGADKTEMNVLIVSFWFPPSNVVGAIRVGKLARYLDRRGYGLRVLTTDIGEDRSLPLEIAREQVIYTEYRQPKDRLASIIRSFRGKGASRVIGGDLTGVTDRTPGKSLSDRLRRHYYGLKNIPDLRRNWIKPAVSAGRALVGEWRPDIMFASAPPFTSLIVSSRLSRALGVPWIADFRDLWVDGPYYGEPQWRRRIDAVLERAMVR